MKEKFYLVLDTPYGQWIVFEGNEDEVDKKQTSLRLPVSICTDEEISSLAMLFWKMKDDQSQT